MTAYQLAVRKARGQRLDTPVPRTWAEAPAPAQVAKKAAEAVGKPRALTKNDVPLVASERRAANRVRTGRPNALGTHAPIAPRQRVVIRSELLRGYW